MVKKVMDKVWIVKVSGIGFIEVMFGFFYVDIKMIEDNWVMYEFVYCIGKLFCESVRFFFSVQFFNIKEMISYVQYCGMLIGIFVCLVICGFLFMVQRGEFNLFIFNFKVLGICNLIYDFDMIGVDGRRLYFYGYKVVDLLVVLVFIQFWKVISIFYVIISEYVLGMCCDFDDEDVWCRGVFIVKGIM